MGNDDNRVLDLVSPAVDSAGGWSCWVSDSCGCLPCSAAVSSSAPTSTIRR